MSPTLKLNRGDTRTYLLSFGIPVADLVDPKIFFTVNPKLSQPDDNGAILQKVITTFTDLETGTFQISMLHSDTNTKAAGDYYYDFQLVHGAEQVISCVPGIFRILPDVTQRITHE